ncbi:MAG: zinc ribbon domain-containing protein [Deltaproteobacteria bacterium]|nr:zinc ribbon domain-containing protein [Deltaproteobacteria bacterium]
MPIYEFECGSCGNRFEDIQLSGHAEPPCPACGSSKVGRLLSATSALTGSPGRSVPDAKGHGCCGEHPSRKGCVPGTCCGRA